MSNSHCKLDTAKVLVIGGGPAGTSSAIWCTKFGLDVVLLDSRNFPRHRPGESLHPGVESLFAQLEVYQDILDANFLRHKGIEIRWGNHSMFRSFGKDKSDPWFGFQACRDRLDNILLKKASNLGVYVLQSCKATDILTEHNRVIGIKASRKEFCADFVIDAGGGQHWIAKKLDLHIEKYTPPLFVQYGYAKGEGSVDNQIPSIVAKPEGWLWTAKVGKDLYQWTRLTFRKEFVPYDWLPESFRNLQRTKPIGSEDVTWRRVMNPSGAGYFIVGDAAFVLDPCSSHGVLKAMMSGIMVADLITKISRAEYSNNLVSKYYNDWLLSWFLHDVTKLKEFYRDHPYPPQWVRH